MEKKPEWLKVPYNQQEVEQIAGMMQAMGLHTVCREANCPNMGECYKKHTATFMILGSRCTRNCRFCNVTHGRPEPVDPAEPQHVADAAKALGLRHVVVTCVTRDDLPDGGAGQFAATIAAIRRTVSGATVEVLISDMQGSTDSLDTVIAAGPDVINHNLETVPELYAQVRPQADYRRSLDVLRYVKQKAPSILTKTGIMVGLGETDEQVYALMRDVRAVGCDILTVGQYLQPSERHIALQAYITPEKFAEYKQKGEEMGFRYVASGPLVRSSYKAQEALQGT